MENWLIPVIVGIVLEYFVIQPFMKSKNVQAFFKNSVRILVDGIRSFSPFVAHLFMKFLGYLTQALAYGLVILVFVATFLFNLFFQYLNSNVDVIQNWAGTQISPNIFVSAILVAIYTIILAILGSLESGTRQVSRLVVTFCAGVILLGFFAPDFLLENELIIEQNFLRLLAITLMAIWSVSLILLGEYKKQYEKIDDNIAFLRDIPQISALIDNESLKLIKKIQQGWSSFIDNPWADGYIDSIKDCFPIKCNGYLLTIGYVADADELVLDNVKGALEQDMQTFFEIPRLKLCFEKIDKQQHRALQNEIIHRKSDTQK